MVNIDHHHDNTRFGTINHVDASASSTAEIVWDLMQGLGVALTPAVAEALYVGLVTDTGRFMYENTGPRSHVMAADLIEAGVDVHAVYRRLYEGVPEPKLALLTRALAAVERYDGGRLTLTRLTREDFAATGAKESFTEGIIDHLRSVEGTKVAAIARELTGEDRAGLLEGLAARDRRRRRRVARGARAGRRRTPPGGRLRDDDGSRRARAVPARRRRRAALTRPSGPRTSSRARRASVTWRPCPRPGRCS